MGLRFMMKSSCFGVPKQKGGEMRRKFTLKQAFGMVGILIMAVVLVLPGNVVAGKGGTSNSQGKWWDTFCEEENPSNYYDSILYCEVGPKLREIEKNSNRVKVEVIGQSAGGRDLYLVTLSDPQAMGRLGKYQAIRKAMLKDPEKAQAMIEKFGDFKVPFYICPNYQMMTHQN